MARVTLYLPEPLYRRALELDADTNLSAIFQDALRAHLARSKRPATDALEAPVAATGK